MFHVIYSSPSMAAHSGHPDKAVALVNNILLMSCGRRFPWQLDAKKEYYAHGSLQQSDR